MWDVLLAIIFVAIVGLIRWLMKKHDLVYLSPCG